MCKLVRGVDPHKHSQSKTEPEPVFFCSGFEFSFCEPFLTLQGSQKRMSHLWQGGGKLLGLFIQILGYDNHPQNEQNKLRK